MNFARPEFLLLLVLLLPYGLLESMAERRYRQRLKRWLPQLEAQERRSRPSFQTLFLRALAFSCMVVAAAQPRWDFEWQDVKRNGADVVIALDVSRSMSAADIDPNRLERAKREIKDLLAISKGDRMALVLYSGVAFIQCPLTHDLNAFALFLDHANFDTLPVQGTSLSAALRFAGKALEEGAEEESQGRAVILISDGEDHEGEAIAVARELSGKGIKIHTIGVGGQGAPLPLGEGGFLKDQAGNLVISKLNESILKDIAQAGDGLYVRSETGDFDLERIYRDQLRPELKDRSHSSREKLWIERQQYFTLAALLLLLTDSFFRRRRQERAKVRSNANSRAYANNAKHQAHAQ